MLVAASLYLLNAQNMLLMDPDEARCALIARDMITSGDWLSPSSPLTSEAHFDKPILYFWLLAGVFKVLGVSEFSARLVTAVGAALLVGTVHRLGRLLFGERAGLLASLMLATSAMMIVAGRFVRMDIWFTLFITLAVYCWCLWHFSEATRWTLLCGYLSMSAALLTKGLVGLLLPAGAIGCFLLVQRHPKWTIVRRSLLLLGMLVIIFTAGVWYGYMEWRFPGYLKDFFYRHHILRMTTDRFGRSQSLVFLPGVLLAGLLPWTAVFVGAALRVVPTRQKGRISCPPGQQLCFWWLGLGLFPMVFSHTQLPVYVLPAFPAALLLAGYHLDLLLKQPMGQSRELWWIFLGTASLMVLSLIALSVINRLTFDSQPWWVFARRLPFLIGGLGALIFVARRGNNLTGLTIIFILTVAAALDVAWVEGPLLAERFSTGGIGKRIRAEAKDDELLIMGPAPAFGVALYKETRQPIQQAGHMIDFLVYIQHPKQVLGVITSPRLLAIARSQMRDRLEVIAQEGGSSLVRLRPPTVPFVKSQPSSRSDE